MAVNKKITSKEQQLAVKADRATRLIQQAVNEALLDHKKNGRSVVMWKDGKTVIVLPEEIEIADEI